MGRRSKDYGDRELEMLAARVRPDIYKQVKAVAKREGLTLTQVVRKAVKEYLAKDRPVAA